MLLATYHLVILRNYGIVFSPSRAWLTCFSLDVITRESHLSSVTFPLPFFSSLPLLLLFFSPSSASNIECWIGVWCHRRPDLFGVYLIFSLWRWYRPVSIPVPSFHRDNNGGKRERWSDWCGLHSCIFFFPSYMLKWHSFSPYVRYTVCHATCYSSPPFASSLFLLLYCWPSVRPWTGFPFQYPFPLPTTHRHRHHLLTYRRK